MVTQFGLFGDTQEIKERQPRATSGQLEMFSTREVLQFGVNAHPLMPLSDKMLLPMLHEDLDRETPEEYEKRQQKAAEENTIPMFTHGTNGASGGDEPPFGPRDLPEMPEQEPEEEPTEFVWKYNNWTNKPTWLVFTWLSNDYSLYHLMNAIVKKSEDEYEAAQRIEDFVDQMIDTEPPVGLAADLMNWAISFVNWPEVAKGFSE